ncbi:MAG: S9 family peptidase [Caulobacter sp.]|nr:S9 family peptidase [Caulobacter sp.]
MSGLAKFWFVLCAVFLLAAPAATAAPVQAYGRLPLIEEAKISPDGKIIAYVVTNNEDRLVLLKSVADGELVGTLKAGDQKVRDLQWATSDYLLITTSQRVNLEEIEGPAREYALATVYDLKKRKQFGLMEHATPAMNVIIGKPQVRIIDGEVMVIVEGVHFFDEFKGRNSLFSVRLRDGRTKVHARGFKFTDDWVIGPDGAPLAESEYDPVSGDWTLKIRKGSSWETADSGNAPLDPPYLAGLGKDGQSVLFVLNDDEGDGVRAREYPADGGAPRNVVLPNYDRLIRDPVTGALIGTASLKGDDYRYNFFDPKAQAAWAAVVKAYPGQAPQLASWSDSRRQMVVRIDNPTVGPSYALADLDRKRADPLGVLYPELEPADISEVRPVHYKAADGLELNGYLTLPRDAAGKKLPLVVLPHGGPASRDTPGFDWWAQAIANRGYAVLQVNFRGSDGFGDDFLTAGYGEWGRKMQTDLSDGVRYLAAQGTIDPARVCIVGASYGGYAALAGATMDPGVYRCAASIAGLSDLTLFMTARFKSDGRRETIGLRYWSQFMGVEGRKDPDLSTISPITFVDRVTIPILLVHGSDDTVVLYDQSKVMYDALNKAGKPVELVSLQDEDHWLSRAPTRVQMLDAVIAFLKKYNPPD